MGYPKVQCQRNANAQCQQNQQLPKASKQNPYEKQNNEILQKIQRAVSAENPKGKYQRLQKVGIGGFGTVYRAREVDTKKEVALKVMKLYFKERGTGHPFIPRYDEEIEIMKLACRENDNIITYVDSFLVGEEVWIITEFVEGLTLLDMWPEQKSSVIGAVVCKILQGLEYIHSKGLVHRDFKADNVMVSRSGEVKLIDFGFCTMVQADMEARKGTQLYMAPEQFGSSYTSKADIWALGITLLRFMTPRIDFIVDRYNRPIIQRTQMNPDLSNFINTCLVVNPDERPSASELLNHKFIQRYKGHSKTILSDYMKML
jgi:p21-activated kinase 1